MKDKLGNKLEIGDILFNPYALDYWVVSSRYNEELDKDELYIKLVKTDYDEDIEIAVSFFKVGSIYDIAIIGEDKEWI